ncbi:MAG: hypothetical protein ACRDK1_01985 [Solirubrobacterales bacterium]
MTARRGLALLAVLGVWMIVPAEAGASVPTGYNPDQLPVASCFWTGPFTNVNPKTNQGFPGSEITYWGAKFATPPGGRVILRGKFAHARFQSLSAYIDNGMATNSLPDYRTRPDRGSVNPFIAGHRRDLPRRSYKVTVRGKDVPRRPAPNTLYAVPDSSGDSYQDILYRVYVPDRGRNRLGGEPLPKPSLKLADGTVLKGRAMCRALNSNHDYQTQNLPLPVYQHFVNWPGKDPATNPADPRFSFEKFFSLGYLLSFFKTPAQHAAADPTPVGTFYNNLDARYMSGAYSFRYGQLLAVRGKLPTVPRTQAGERTMGHGQLREWDMCVEESLAVTGTYKCLYDEQLPLAKGRRYVIVVGKAANRPDNATRRCGVAWLPADPIGDGAGRRDAGSLVTRNVVPARGFHHSSWDVTKPNTAPQVMGRYLPRGSYLSRHDFEAKGCPFHW